jgi:DNA-binding Lrp family transcriptional regulator
VIVAPNFISLGYTAWARIGIKVAPGSLSRVARSLVENPLIYFVAYTLGRFDIIISAYFDTIDKLTHFVNSELTKVRGIRSIETMLLVSPRKYNQFSWPAPIFENRKNVLEPYRKAAVSDSHYELDEVDRRILNILMEDGPLRPKALKSRLEISESTIRKHLKDMSQNGVFKLEVVPITDLLEYESQATMGITISRESPHKIIDSIIENPSVYLASVSLGRFNLIIATRFRTTDLLNHFVTTTLPSIPGISSTETYFHVKRLKYCNLTWPIS